jgi:hypothetical protein
MPRKHRQVLGVVLNPSESDWMKRFISGSRSLETAALQGPGASADGKSQTDCCIPPNELIRAAQG